MADADHTISSSPPQSYDLNAKLDACVNLAVNRTLRGSVAGAFTGLLLFRSPVSRWASIAFGAGVGIGSAYIESSYIYAGYLPTPFAKAASCLKDPAPTSPISEVSAASPTPTQEHI